MVASEGNRDLKPDIANYSISSVQSRSHPDRQAPSARHSTVETGGWSAELSRVDLPGQVADLGCASGSDGMGIIARKNRSQALGCVLREGCLCVCMSVHLCSGSGRLCQRLSGALLLSATSGRTNGVCCIPDLDPITLAIVKTCHESLHRTQCSRYVFRRC
ncbi:hypothetical protein LIA77_08845 [Sarocladium implicatum]|nr:hypothetical protein LIA77_08845 [Sarocladium implicatum]